MFYVAKDGHMALYLFVLRHLQKLLYAIVLDDNHHNVIMMKMQFFWVFEWANINYRNNLFYQQQLVSIEYALTTGSIAI